MPPLIPAAPQDAPALVRILRDWIAETPWMPMLHTEASMQAHWAGRLAAAHALTTPDRAGFLVRAGVDILALYVARPARGRGLGTRLLAAAKAASPRLDLWTMQANTAARRFYARHGFVEVTRTDGDNEEGLPDVALRWTR